MVDHFGHRIGYRLAGFQRGDAAQQAVDAMGFALVALRRNHAFGDRHDIGLGESVLA